MGYQDSALNIAKPHVWILFLLQSSYNRIGSTKVWPLLAVTPEWELGLTWLEGMRMEGLITHPSKTGAKGGRVIIEDVVSTTTPIYTSTACSQLMVAMTMGNWVLPTPQETLSSSATSSPKASKTQRHGHGHYRAKWWWSKGSHVFDLRRLNCHRLVAWGCAWPS